MPNLRLIASLLKFGRKSNRTIEKQIGRFKEQLNAMKRSKSERRFKPHKPVLLLAVLDLFESGVLKENRISFEPQLIETFESYFSAIAQAHDWAQPSFPYFHLRNDGFWKHKPVPGKETLYAQMRKPGGGSKRINDVIEYAYLDKDAFAAFSDPNGRQAIREFILETFFTIEEREKLRQVMSRQDGVIGSGSPNLPVQAPLGIAVESDGAPTVIVTSDDSAPSLVVEQAQRACSTLLEVGERPQYSANRRTEAIRLDSPVELLTLSARARNILLRRDIRTVVDLLKVTDAELRSLRGVGAQTWQEIEKVRLDLRDLGLQPTSEHPDDSRKMPAPVDDTNETLPLPLIETLDSWRDVLAGLKRAWPEAVEALAATGVQTDTDLLNSRARDLAQIEDVTDDAWGAVFWAFQGAYRCRPISLLPGYAVGWHGHLKFQENFPRHLSSPESWRTNSSQALERLGLSARTRNALVRSGVVGCVELAWLTFGEILCVRNFGQTAFKELLSAFRKNPDLESTAESPQVLDHQSALVASDWPRDLLIPPSDLAYLARLGIPLHQIAVKRLGISARLERKLIGLGLNTVGELASVSKQDLAGPLGEGGGECLDVLTANLSVYLDYVAKQTQWEPEVAGDSPSPVNFVRLKETTLENLVDGLLGRIDNNRNREVLALRYGLDGGAQQKLSEIAEAFGLTRERVRQVEQRAFMQLRAASDDPLLSAMFWSVEQEMAYRGGLMSLAQIGEHVETLTETGEVDRDGALRLLLELRSSTFHKIGSNRWLLPDRSADLVISTESELASILRVSHAPLPFDQLYANLCNSEWYARYEDPVSITRQWVAACLSTNEQFEEREDGMWGLSKWGRSCTDEIVLALRKLGKPSHYTEVAIIVNELLPPDERISARNVHTRLQQKSALFVRTGSGVYGLCEWGLGRVRFYRVIVREFLERKGEPQPLEAIAAAVSAERPVSPASLSILLSTNPEFKMYPGGRFGLTAWSERDTESIESEASADDDFIETLKDQLFSDLLGGNKAKNRWS